MTIQKLRGRVTGVYGIKYKTKVYIGSSIHIRNRWNGHMSEMKRGVHSCQALQRIFDSYNKERLENDEEPSFDCFDFFVIKTLDQEFVSYHYNRLVDISGSKNAAAKLFDNLILFKIEQVYMNIHPSKRLNSLPAAGSNKGYSPKPSTRKKNGDAHRNTKRSDATKKKISEARMGYEMRLESRQKLSKAKMGVPRDPESVERGAAKLRKPFKIYKAGVGYIEGFGLKTYAKVNKISYSGLRDVVSGKYPMSNMHFRSEEDFLLWLEKKNNVTSVHDGVYLHSATGQYMARIHKGSFDIYIGRSKIELEAAEMALIGRQVYDIS